MTQLLQAPLGSYVSTMTFVNVIPATQAMNVINSIDADNDIVRELFINKNNRNIENMT